MRVTSIHKLYFAIFFGLLIHLFGCSQKEEEEAAPEQAPQAQAASSDAEEEEEVEEVKEETPAEETVEDDEVLWGEETDFELISPLSEETLNYASANASDRNALDQCMRNWTKSLHPFDTASGTLTYRKVTLNKITGTVGIALDDSEKNTETPQLVLIEANETIGSILHFKMGNPNGWYCYKNIDRLGTDTLFKLHCNAKVSEHQFWTNLKMSISWNLQQSGVVVSQDIDVKHIRPTDVECPDIRK